jgi:translocation and assembly module TamA
MAKNKMELGQAKQSWQGELISHPQTGHYRKLIAGHMQREEAAGTIVRSSRIRLGRTQDTEANERIFFLEAISAGTRTEAPSELRSVTTNTSHRALSGNLNWIARHLDSLLLPTDGESLNAQWAAGYAMGGEAANNGVFGRLYGRFSLYRRLGSSWYFSSRIEAGQVFAASKVGIPDNLLFRAGGDDSVRGYAYRSLGPLEAGLVRSARVIATGSVELARPISSQLPHWWWAGFLDAGNTADHWSTLKPQWGYGLGLRWRSPVGPIKLDAAQGQSARPLRLHFSVGVSF